STLLAVAGGLGVELSRLVEVLDRDIPTLDEEPPMKDPKDPVEVLRQKLARKDSLIRKWTGEAEACDPSDDVGRAGQRDFRGLARWQQEERARLEAEMHSLMQQ